MVNAAKSAPSEAELERLLELATNPEFKAQLESFKKQKASILKKEYQAKIAKLDAEAKQLKNELDKQLSTLGIESPKAKPSKGTTRVRRTKEQTEEVLGKIQALLKKTPGITAGEISMSIGESASPFLNTQHLLCSFGLARCQCPDRGRA